MLTADDAHTLKAYLDGVDHVAKEAEAEWGMDRLPLLVDAELRAKFYRQQERWRTALDAAYTAKVLTRGLLEDVAKKSGAMQRAWEALIAAATEAGHRPITPWVWEARLRDGTVAAFVQSTAEVSKVLAEGRYVVVYTLAEIANVIDAIPDTLAMAKLEFPGAKIQAPVDRSWVKHGEPIPF